MPEEIDDERLSPSYIEWCAPLQLHTRFGGRQFRVSDVFWTTGPHGDQTYTKGDPRNSWLPGLGDWIERLFAIPVAEVKISRQSHDEWQVAAITTDGQPVFKRGQTVVEAAGRLCVELTR